MYEFAVPVEDHLEFVDNPNTLFSLAIGLVGDAAAALATSVEGDDRRETAASILSFASTFFDSYIDARLDGEVREEFSLLAAASYYLQDAPGNARLLVSRIEPPARPGAQSLDWLVYKLLRSDFDVPVEEDFSRTLAVAVLKGLEAFFRAAGDSGPILDLAREIRAQAYREGDGRAVLYADLSLAIVQKKFENASRFQLPRASNLSLEAWLDVVRKDGFISELWPAQRRICDAGLLRGRSGVVQMPTSAGKTRATELIIRSAFLADRTQLAVIVSPFRALCHDIRADLAKAFSGENIGLDEASDSFQFDVDFEALFERKAVLIVTPEKLLYILRREPELAFRIGLIIYDEGHQFDSLGRGAGYELLLTSLKLLLPDTTQTVLMSAVIANAHSVAEWLIGDADAVVNGEGLLPTSRSVAFASWATQVGQLKYVNPLDPEDDEFFVPRVIEGVVLGARPGERAPRRFPIHENGTSIGLYLGLKVVGNGSVAIFCGRKDTAANLCATAVEIFDRGYGQAAPIAVSDREEVGRLRFLFERNFGAEADATRAAELAIFPHHANVPHGLRLSIEHAMKESLIRFVICTSTLAQGVNLPIKYLIVTGVYQGTERIMVRDFHNLIGRAGRAGMHTEGSVIFSQNNVFDQRRDRRQGWRWQTACDLLNPQNSEPCASSILLLFVPFTYGRPARSILLDMATIHTLVFDDPDEIDRVVADIIESFPDADPKAVRRYLEGRAHILQSVASFLLAHLEFGDASLIDDADILCSNTLAYHLADEEQRAALILLFRNITSYVAEQAPTDELRQSIRRSALAPATVRQLTIWVAENIEGLRLNLFLDALFEAVAGQMIQYSTSDAITSLSDPNAAVGVAALWIQGQSFQQIHTMLVASDVRIGGNRRRVTVEDTVGICENGLGYDGAMLVSTLGDLAALLDEDLGEALALLQKRLKYGLPTAGAIAFFEIGFADRTVSLVLSEAFPHAVDRLTATLTLRASRAEADELIRPFPIYFRSVLDELTRG